MFRHRPVIQNEAVAHHTKRFFNQVKKENLSAPDQIAKAYGEFFWDRTTQSLLDAKKVTASRYYVGLSAELNDFEYITKRAALVSDTLLLSHNWTGDYHELTVQNVRATKAIEVPTKPKPPPNEHERDEKWRRRHKEWFAESRSWVDRQLAATERDNQTEMCGMQCPSLSGLGQWIRDAEPLLTAGLAWYLPSYSLSRFETRAGVRRARRYSDRPQQVEAIDYLVRDGRAVDTSGTEPIKGQLVRHVLHVDLPFLEGVNLREYGKITVGEFSSYISFRDFLRRSFLDIDESMNAVQSEREVAKLGLEIKDQVRSMRADMVKARRKKALASTGVVVGSVSAVLVAVYGPALAAAVAAIGAGGGVWSLINSATENSTRALRMDKWYYVWALAKENETTVI